MLAGAFSCHHLNAHRSDEYIVPEASDGDVTDTACPSRILLVEQQVSLSLLIRDRNRHTSDFPRRTKLAYRSLTISILSGSIRGHYFSVKLNDSTPDILAAFPASVSGLNVH